MKNFNVPGAYFLTDADRETAANFNVQAAIADATAQRSKAGLDIDPDFRRADQHCVCDQCGKEYWQHPYDTRYPIAPSMWVHADRPEYILHLLCDGSLVKL
jgi:hypothetical protein